MRHRVLLFDIDHTLVVTGGAGRRALEDAVREVTGRAVDLLRVPFAGRTDPAILADLLASVGLPAPGPGEAEAILARYVERLDRDLGDGEGVTILPGVMETLAALEGRPRVHLGILTGNIERGARVKLRCRNLWSRFHFGAFGDEAATRPDLLPVAVARWRRLLGDAAPPLAPEDVTVIGDTEHDVAVARAHGARAVAVGTGGRQTSQEALRATRPDRYLADLTHAGPWIDEILSG